MPGAGVAVSHTDADSAPLGLRLRGNREQLSHCCHTGANRAGVTPEVVTLEL